MRALLPISLLGSLLAACDGGQGPICGSWSPERCGRGEFCDYTFDECGLVDGPGECRARPEFCNLDLAPVCGCDGRVYDNLCDAQSRGVDVSAQASCQVPDGFFRCGYRFCNGDISYCRIVRSDVDEVPDDYVCAGMPASCAEPADCACVTDDTCSSCEASDDGGLIVTCPGG